MYATKVNEKKTNPRHQPAVPIVKSKDVRMIIASRMVESVSSSIVKTVSELSKSISRSM